MEEQMHKQFYCPVDKCKTIFVQHTTKKGLFICTSCRFTTSNPREGINETRKKPMEKFWENMSNKLISYKSS